jgi:cell division protein FtsL
MEQVQPSPKRLFTRKVTKGEKVLWTIALLALFAVSVYIVSTFASIYTLNRNISQLETKMDRQAKVNSELQEKVYKLKRPERISKIGKDKLGLKMRKNSVKSIEGNE